MSGNHRGYLSERSLEKQHPHKASQGVSTRHSGNYTHLGPHKHKTISTEKNHEPGVFLKYEQRLTNKLRVTTHSRSTPTATLALKQPGITGACHNLSQRTGSIRFPFSDFKHF
ncbi:unnamed protein product [Polarella glacialis]|uniref:Uncharacterized protein n=1 Tax=Polarella glacialis TaxID=89957 RepID=A0A813J7T1_POLGL|nr:unnamed protein product [Polarella glacialis]